MRAIIMRICVLAVGKLQEQYLRDGIAEYLKRLKRYCKLEIIEVADEKAPESLSPAEQDIVLKKEGEKLLCKITNGSIVIALDIRGKRMTSEDLAAAIKGYMVSGIPDITFVIGGSLGLDGAVLEKAALRLSLSDMTFPHQLTRLIILEQIYRAFKIINGETYHK
jgi:23S rRNA (pseudouridine1915-N3)-methyltransferase